MAFNYAEKYSPVVDERFKKASLTDAAVGDSYDWSGVSTIKIYSVETSPLVDYQMSGDKRYGIPDEIGTDLQELPLSQDKAFTFTVDRRSLSDQMMVTEVGAALRRQVDEVIIPEVDKYRVARVVAGAGTTVTMPLDAPYEAFLDGVTTLSDNKVPLAGTYAWISSKFYKGIRLDDAFIKSGDLSQQMLIRGQVGMVDNVPIIHVPTDYLPTGVEFIITNRIATVGAVKLESYRTHEDPPGISGYLCEGRIYHDIFVLNNKNKAIYVHKSA